MDRDFIKEFPGAQDRAERIGAYFPPCSFTTIMRYGTMFKRKRDDNPGWAARVFSSSTALQPVPSAVTSSEDVAPSFVDEAGTSSELPPPSSEDVAPSSVDEAGASSELPPPVVSKALMQTSNKKPAQKAVSKKPPKIKAISKRSKQRRKVQAPWSGLETIPVYNVSQQGPRHPKNCQVQVKPTTNVNFQNPPTPAEQVPVSAYGGSLKNLKDLKDLQQAPPLLSVSPGAPCLPAPHGHPLVRRGCTWSE